MILSDYAIKFRTAVFVAIFVFVLAGAINYASLPREGMPDITIPFVYVTAVYEGTAPSEMEKLVAIPLEKTLGDLENVSELRSSVSEGVCMVSVKFVAGQDIEMARQRVKDKVDLARHDLPSDLDQPIVDAFNLSSDIPVFIFALSGNADALSLKNAAENIVDEIELLPGVKQADISGIREREIRVELDLVRLIAYGIPLSTVMQKISAENSTISAGNIETSGNKIQVRVPGEFAFVSDLKGLLLSETSKGPVYLRDIATVLDTYKDLSSISRLGGKPCVSVAVKKRGRENTVLLINRVKEIIKHYDLPSEIEYTIVMDASYDVTMMIQELENNVVSGFILVLVVLFLFMGWRNSIFVAVAIPFSMMIAFSVLAITGQTLNMMVLFALVLAVGMLVDNAIVIVENIYRHHSLGLDRQESARLGTSEVAWPVITSTLTTLAVFSPLLFWPDMMGQFMGYLPKTLIAVLTASLFVAIVVNPAICSLLISRGKKRITKKTRMDICTEVYERFLREALKHRLPVILIGVSFLILSIVLYAEFGEGKELFPDVEPRNAVISLTFPQGTAIEKTDIATKAIESHLKDYDDVVFYLTTVGGASGLGPWGNGGGGHKAQIHLEFKEWQDRKGLTSELVDTIRSDLGAIPGADLKVEKQRDGPPMGAPISIELSGDDFEVLSALSSKVMNEIRVVPGLVDLQDDFEEALPELQFRVDRARAALLGLDTRQIGVFLRTAIYGMEASKLRADEDEYDITLRLPLDQRDNARLLDRIYIPIKGGIAVPLSSLGVVVYTGGRGSISRKNQKRVITISGNNAGRATDKVLKDVRNIVDKIELPRGYAVGYAGDSKEMEESGAFLKKAFAIALALMLVVLVIQFNSVLLPGLILVTVILSLIGVMLGLLLCRMRFGVIMTGIGGISLAGIVVNNAIVLIDCVLQRRKEGMASLESIIVAGKMRLRPVVLTAITTILGLIPMALGWTLDIHSFPPVLMAGSETSQWWAPMAVAVIFGLGFATVLTLILLPVMYSLMDSFTVFLRRWIRL